MAEGVAEAQCVDHGRGVFDFSIDANGGSLAAGLDLLRRHLREQPTGHFLAQGTGDADDLGPQVFDKAFAGPGVLDDGGNDNDVHRPRRRPATLDVGFFKEGADFSDAEVHGVPPSVALTPT